VLGASRFKSSYSFLSLDDALALVVVPETEKPGIWFYLALSRPISVWPPNTAGKIITTTSMVFPWMVV
jgi:hypothetical protein